MEKEKTELIRTRFAPSPSGFLHIGSARTALFNYLFAKQNNGIFILRIEDTNQETSKIEYEQEIINSLKWLGLDWDEGPVPTSLKEVGEFSIFPAERDPVKRDNNQFSKNKKEGKESYIGEYGPYRQSERLDIYKKYIEKLLKEEKAYYCFCSEEDLEGQRQYQLSKGEAPRYSGECANLSKEDTEELLKEKEKCVVRFRAPIKKIKFTDTIRGKLEFDTAQIGDFVIAKKEINSENYNPLYNFSVTIDDFEMKISHVIRGEDLLSNTPKQILLQETLDFPSIQYVHLPLILDTDKTKLSKRQGATAISEFKELGYLPETLLNFIAFLGWNPGDDREIFYKPSLIKEFSLEKVQKGGAIFNIDKLNHLNGFYIRQKSAEKLTELCIPYLIKQGLIESI